MTQLFRTFTGNLAREIKRGAVGILPTDTIYGIVGSALLPKAVSRIYKLRKRNRRKPFIVLISSLKDLGLFGIGIDGKAAGILKHLWPGKVSVLLPVLRKKFLYLDRGTKRIAFRLPAGAGLRRFLKKTGPLIAPSANWEGYPPAKNIEEARRYFGDKADFYLDKGTLESLPSTLISLEKGRVKIIREGAAKIAKSVAL